MNTIACLSRWVPIAALSLLLVGPGIAHAEPWTNVGADGLAQDRSSSSRGDPKASKAFQCAANERKLRTISSEPVQRGLRAGISSLAIRPSDPADSYHCCDGEGNCSEPVDALTICPVIKVWCRYEDNQCICD
jgi:hypothetical protein